MAFFAPPTASHPVTCTLPACAPAAGSRLLCHLSKVADREGLPLYLEASNERK